MAGFAVPPRNKKSVTSDWSRVTSHRLHTCTALVTCHCSRTTASLFPGSLPKRQPLALASRPHAPFRAPCETGAEKEKKRAVIRPRARRSPSDPPNASSAPLFQHQPAKPSAVVHSPSGSRCSHLSTREKKLVGEVLRAETQENSGLPCGDVGADDLYEPAGGFEGFLCFVVRYEARVVIKGQVPLSPETVEDCEQASVPGVDPRANEIDDRDVMAQLTPCPEAMAEHKPQRSPEHRFVGLLKARLLIKRQDFVC